MGKEIERRFLVNNREWYDQVFQTQTIMQGYLTDEKSPLTVRVRIIEKDAWITLKKGEKGTFIRSEFEYKIPYLDGITMLKESQIGYTIFKQRHFLYDHGREWIVDCFEKENQGLVIAEIELNSPDDTFVTPLWVGQEITTEYQYCNSFLSQKPYQSWDNHINVIKK